MNNKLTDSEIIKALECCVSEQYTCEQCPYQEKKHYDYDNGFEIMPNGKQYDDWSCDRWLLTDLLDLINRLQEKNSNLTSDLTSLQNDLTSLQAENERLIPKKVNISLKGTTGWNTKCHCPNCGTFISNGKYCSECGQALNWGGIVNG